MARDTSEIYDAAVLAKQNVGSLTDLQPSIDNSQTLLNDLTTPSKVARWRIWLWTIAEMIGLHEIKFDEHKAEIEARANELITGTKLWYRDQALSWQFGDALLWNGNRYEYPSINATTQIIKRAAVVEVGGQVQIKVAKLDGAGLPTPLTTNELSAFSSYIQLIKFAGTNILLISREADLLKLNATIFYNPLLMSTTGELLSSPGIFPVNDAITNFIQRLPFNGRLDLSELNDAIQGAIGVVSPFINSAQAKYGTLAYTAFSDFYQSEAGHLTIDPLNPLDATITYEAYV